MKKRLSFVLSLLLLASILTAGATASVSATSVSAMPTTASVLVNGTAVQFEAYNIFGSNYFRLRDLAKALNGTSKQFEVGWDSAENAIRLTSGASYTPFGGELSVTGCSEEQAASVSTAAVYLDGAVQSLGAYNIAGSTYFKLRDVAQALNFGVGWDSVSGTITLDTSVGYTAVASALKVHFLDVGQGDSIFVELPDGKTMLIDAGESEYGDDVVSYIKNLGYNRLDYLVATHPHADHIGGMTTVVESLEIGSFYMPDAETTTKTFEKLMTAVNDAKLGIMTAKAGVCIFDSNGLSAYFLAPNSESYDDLNNYSAVIKLSYGKSSFLFMGDAEELSEKEITAELKADVLKVGHHGSASSTGEAFLEKVSPKYAVISVGANNDYGHPAQETLDRLSAVGAEVYRTDKNGTIIMNSDGMNISVTEAKGSAS